LIRKRTQRRFVVWLASVALGLLLFAPSISRVLYAWSANDADIAALAGEPAGHLAHGHAGMPDHPGMPERPGVPSNGDVCGYCTLMCHNPVLASALAFVILPPPRTPYSTAFAETRAPVPVLLDRRSRGPPVA
jgi:hypothetical protein